MTKELIKVEVSSVGNEEVNTVNARELYEFLGIKDDFSTWIKYQFERAKLLENKDYIVFRKNPENGGRPKIEYYLTIKSGKHIAMMSNSNKGYEVREYFIEVEKEYNKSLQKNKPSLPQTYLEALKELVVQVELNIEQTKQLEEAKPKVEFYDDVTQSDTTIDMSEVAKILSIKGYGRNNIYKKLKEENILMDNNQPYQKYVDNGYFKLVETKFTINDIVNVSLKTVVSQKGLDYIRKLLK